MDDVICRMALGWMERHPGCGLRTASFYEGGLPKPDGVLLGTVAVTTDALSEAAGRMIVDVLAGRQTERCVRIPYTVQCG